MVTIAHASIDENGKIKGGRAGDQTGKEVCTRAWYNKPWDYVIRFKDKDKAEKVAYAMKAAAGNPCIGYNQNRRNSALQLASHAGYDPGKIKQDCDTDCSALVSLACIYAGIPEQTMTPGGNSCTTANLRQVLEKTGLVEVFSDKEHTQKDYLLEVGDILLRAGHHVAVVVDTGTKTVKKETPRPNPLPDLKYGDKGQAVKYLQEQLIKKGYSVGLYGADGDYGTGTLKGLLDFIRDQKCLTVTKEIWDKI